MYPVEWLPEWIAYPLYVIWLDQTLIAGFMAAIAAVFTIRQIKLQIGQAEEHKQEAHKRRHRMLRAGLPTALAEITTYAEECAANIWIYRHSRSRTTDISLPSLPSEALRSVQAVVETADEPTVSDLETLILFLQIQNSRLDRFYTGARVHSAETAEHFGDALFVKAAAVRLFEYARRERDEADEWADEAWARNQITFVALPTGAGVLPSDKDLERSLERRWLRVVNRYGVRRDVKLRHVKGSA